MCDKRKVRWATSAFSEDCVDTHLTKKTDEQSSYSKNNPAEQLKLSEQTGNSKNSTPKLPLRNRKTEFVTVEKSFDPVCEKDLALSKKRLEPLQQWFYAVEISSKKNRILLLLGPDGCGKTAAVKVLAKEKQMEIVEWSEPDFIPGVDGYTPQFDVNNLKTFLCRAGRYSNSQKLIVVEDLPLSVLSAKGDLTTVIHNYSTTGKCPLVIIISHTDRYSVFNAEAQKLLDMDVIVFKRITDASIKKALNRIIGLKGLPCEKYASIVSHITEMSCGNIRKAISELKFYVPESKFIAPRKGLWKIEKHLGRKPSDRNADLELKEDSGIFHAVARVLYAKRETIGVAQENKVKHGSELQGELEHKPVEICDKYFQFRRQFVNLMFCNYAKIFHSIHDIANAADYMSESDILSSLWWEKPVSEDAGFVLAVGGVMTSCHNVVKKWQPLKGEAGLSAKNIISLPVLWNIRKTQLLFANLSEVILCTEIIPYMMKFFQYCSMKVPKCSHGFYTHDHHHFVLQMEQWKNEYELQHTYKSVQRMDSAGHKIQNARNFSLVTNTEAERKQLEEPEAEEDEVIIEEVHSD
ncbi:cell cycle checkpoint protein RAD17 [Schistocerca nitens]|uniref:cell cycle checkpoint protein RAD17 n=1 Tax=Schistocerca nitens TaxID=7011 RepID=UPI002118980C|nr:cell cycle checkpoint protein RAD17 [Schistocerca nitens]